MVNKNIYTFEKLIDKENCAFCSETKTGIYWLRTRRLRDRRLLSLDYCCEDCKEKFDRDELEKCSECERLYRQEDFRIDLTRTLMEQSETNLGEWICMCQHLKRMGKSDENTDEETKVGGNASLEIQFHELSLEKQQLEEDIEIHFDAIKTAETWGKSKTEKELIEQNREIEEKRRRLSNENKGLKIKVEELEKKVGKLNLENGTLKSTLSVIKSQILQLDVKIDGEYETRIEVLPKE